jgi:glucose/arabinose dehydrogenase
VGGPSYRQPVRHVRLLALALALLAVASGSCHGGSRKPAAGSPSADGFAVTTVASGLGPVTDLAFLPDGRMVVTEKDGALRLVAPGGAATEAGRFPVDTESEKGLLGVAVDPSFAQSGRLILYYSRSDAAGGSDLDRNRVVAVTLGGDGKVVAGSEVPLVTGLRGPANHDGGALAIGPDGKLYVGVGDTGCNNGRPPEPPSEPTNFFATCLTNGNGKILRVELDGSAAADNPLSAVAQVTACGGTCGAAPDALGAPRLDVWAWGFRNPWRFAFDPVTGRLWVGDVGEASYEELTIVEPGRHHGWPWREGRHGWPVARCEVITPDAGPCVDPVYECRHGSAAGGVDGGCQSITGGAFLTGPRWPEALRDRYVFADNVLGTVFVVRLTADRLGVVAGSRQVLDAAAGGTPATLRAGPDGDLYVGRLAGSIVRISPGQ